jgi:LmbE family N-acetylglucosaminyl deacetylase
MTSYFEENWQKGTKILVILAHPDDPEFFMGGTIARWVEKGYIVQYCLLTKGEKGINPGFPEGEALAALRVEEQKAAAAVLGVHSVQFLDFVDGYLEVGLDKRLAVTRVIRNVKPNVVVSCDPQSYYIADTYLNHPDHRTAGQIVVDSVYPAAINNAFFPELLEEGLPAVEISELWLSLTPTPNVTLDVDAFWEQRLKALLEHKSQIVDPERFLTRMQANKAHMIGQDGRYYEFFRRIRFH